MIALLSNPSSLLFVIALVLVIAGFIWPSIDSRIALLLVIVGLLVGVLK